MERTQPPSPSAPESVLPPLGDLALQHDIDPQWTVLIWEPQPTRLQLITRIVSDCGAQPHWVEGLSAVRQVECSRSCNLAVIGLGVNRSPTDVELTEVRSLKRNGFKVICYEEGTQLWPLGQRSKVFLAGALCLLDSAKAGFAQELERRLIYHLEAETGRRDEEKRVNRAMKALGSVGESQAIKAIFRTILRVSTLSDLPILITGETGTGKELLAKAIHRLDPKRCHGPFVALNCSAISPALAESELFGHRRGAFTGAERNRKGLIRSAEGGVFFLDEIGELSEVIQAKLLRVLQENRVLGIGEDQEVSISVRIVAATNRDLDAMVQQGKFRADLFHRLNVLSIHIPPLRERPADLKPLIEHFLEKYRFLRPTKSLSVAADFIDALAQVQLPGNARQLENLIRWALVNKDDNTPLNLCDLPFDIWRQLSEQDTAPQNLPETITDEEALGTPTQNIPHQDLPSSIVSLLDVNGWNLSRFLQCCERILLEAALHKTHGNQSQTARLLGITARSVYNKIHKHQLHR